MGSYRGRGSSALPWTPRRPGRRLQFRRARFQHLMPRRVHSGRSRGDRTLREYARSYGVSTARPRRGGMASLIARLSEEQRTFRYSDALFLRAGQDSSRRRWALARFAESQAFRRRACQTLGLGKRRRSILCLHLDLARIGSAPGMGWTYRSTRSSGLHDTRSEARRDPNASRESVCRRTRAGARAATARGASSGGAHNPLDGPSSRSSRRAQENPCWEKRLGRYSS
jgi:hypothetical protein